MSLTKIVYLALVLMVSFTVTGVSRLHAEELPRESRRLMPVPPPSPGAFGFGEDVVTTKCFASAHVAKQNTVTLYLDFASKSAYEWPACRKAMANYFAQNPAAPADQAFKITEASHKDAEVASSAPNGVSCLDGGYLGYIVTRCWVAPVWPAGPR